MSKISKYTSKRLPTLNDKVIGTDESTLKKETLNFALSDIQDLILSGFPPGLGGYLKITEVIYNGVKVLPSVVANNFNPFVKIQRYEIFILNVNGNKYQLKKQGIIIGLAQTPLTEEDFISISLTATKLSTAISFYKGFNSTTSKEEFYSIGSTGFTIIKELNSSNQETGKILLEQTQQTSKGDGELIYLGFNSITKLQEYTTLKSNTLVFTKEIVNSLETGALFIDTPIDLSIRSFYVNSNYTGVSNGSITKPYKKLTEALVAVIGTETPFLPQFFNAKIILQTEVTVLQADMLLPSNLILQNKLSVNGTSIVSDIGEKNIYFYGNTNYPIDTEFLMDGVGFDSNLKLKNSVFLGFENISITAFTTFGILKHKGYYNGTLFESQNGSQILSKNLNLICKFLPDSSYSELLDSNGNNILIFGFKSIGQSNIENTVPHVYIKGINADNNSHFDNENLSILGTSQTVLKIENSLFQNTRNKISISRDFRYLNIQGQVSNGVYLPKPDVSLVECVNSSFVRMKGFTEENQFPYNETNQVHVGGDNSYFKLINSNLILEDHYSYGSHNCNYFAEMDETSNLSNTTALTQNIPIKISHLKNIGIFSSVKNINFESSNGLKFNNSNFKLIATNAKVNGFTYSSTQGFVNDAQALSNGLIIGNVYYNTTINALKQIV